MTSLSPGTRFGSFEIKDLTGRGGMGEVYRAHDVRLDRTVAIKVLPPGFATDADRLARFEREAKTLASLNHPNVAQIYGFEDAAPTRAIIMEFVEGDELSVLIDRGSLSRPRALAIARQIAIGTQAAHDQGIVHRDLKPANVKVKSDGTVKILDFGLAKVIGADSVDAKMTLPGTLLGTLGYMAPEQIEGEPGDEQSDVWAFGCILFEMLSGEQPFARSQKDGTIASTLTGAPAWGRLSGDTPESIRRLLRRCLEKKKAHRLRSLADAVLEIDDASSGDQGPRSAPQSRRGIAALAVGLVGLALGVGLVAGGWRGGRSVEPASEVRFDIETPDVNDPGLLPAVSLSPDGRQILFVANTDGVPHAWVRGVDNLAPTSLAGTRGATFPFWSPDGRSVAFYADGYLKRLDIDGGLVRSLARVIVGYGGSWNDNGVVLFVRNPATAIARVSADGGEEETVTRLEAGHVGHAFPNFLPDGEHFLFYVTAAPEIRGIYVGQLDNPASRRLIDADGGGLYMDGHVFFIRQGAVYAQPFDATRIELEGRAFQVADGVYGRAGGQSMAMTAAGGAIVFRAGSARFVRQFTWVDRSGSNATAVGSPLGNPDGVSSSPDRSQLVFFERGAASSDLWMFDTRRGLATRFTEDLDEDIFPLWARDGSRIVYTVVRDGAVGLYAKPVIGGERQLLLAPQSEELFASDTSPDGTHIIYQRNNAQTGFDIWALPSDDAGQSEGFPVLRTEADERSGRLSPDGRWLSFVANNSGAFEVYVQPFPGPGPRVQVSTRGGDQQQWRSDGAELFYLAVDGMVMSVPIQTSADGQMIDLGEPTPLFAAGVGGAVRPVISGDFTASLDGQRFLLNRLLRDAGAAPLRAIVNWQPPDQP